jgi:hypothetical protein
VTNEEIWVMLRRGGLSVETPASDAGEKALEPVLVGRYHGTHDPAATDKLGVLLADKARTVDANVIVVGEGGNDLVLGFVVARELGVPVVRVLNLEGLVGASGVLPAHPKAAFIADRIHKREFVIAVRNLVDREGGELVVVASLVTSSIPLPVSRLGLVSVEEGLLSPR